MQRILERFPTLGYFKGGDAFFLMLAILFILMFGVAPFIAML